MATLYDFELSAECYRVRLLLGILGVTYDVVPVDVFPGREHRSDWFLRVSPMGTLPVLVDDGTSIASSLQILEHLARRDDPSGLWFPTAMTDEIGEFLGTAQLLSESAGATRLVVNFGYDDDLQGAQHEAHQLLREFDEHLWFGEREGRDWLCTAPHPTIADIACFPDIALCEEGGISRQDYPAVRRWLDRVKRVPGFTTMSGVFPTAPALAT
jgi:glutathione S-transferase